MQELVQHIVRPETEPNRSSMAKTLRPLIDWRHWPMELLFLPLTIWVFLTGVFRAGHLFYFAAANPGVSLGGFAGDSKSAILAKVPENNKLRTIRISENNTAAVVLRLFEDHGFSFPVYVKPDLGEGGFLVRKIFNATDLLAYHGSHKMSYLVQRPAVGKLELAVLVHNASGSLTISSITERHPLILKADGISSWRKLLSNTGLSFITQQRILAALPTMADLVPACGEVLTTAPAGNLAFGTEFIQRDDLVNEEVLRIFTQLNNTVGLFNYARYDIICKNESQFLSGQFKVVEINGVKGEPIHLYDRRYSLWGAYYEIFKHWNIIYQISMREMKSGFTCPGTRSGAGTILHHLRAKRQALKPR